MRPAIDLTPIFGSGVYMCARGHAVLILGDLHWVKVTSRIGRPSVMEVWCRHTGPGVHWAQALCGAETPPADATKDGHGRLILGNRCTADYGTACLDSMLPGDVWAACQSAGTIGGPGAAVAVLRDYGHHFARARLPVWREMMFDGADGSPWQDATRGRVIGYSMPEPEWELAEI